MKAQIELVLDMKDGNWVARSHEFEIAAEMLDQLEAKVQEYLDASGRFAQSTKITVFMACDRDIIPPWIRPYQSHYFNRIISFVL